LLYKYSQVELNTVDFNAKSQGDTRGEEDDDRDGDDYGYSYEEVKHFSELVDVYVGQQ